MIRKLLFSLVVLTVFLALGEAAVRLYLFRWRGWTHLECDRRQEFDYYLTYANAPGFDRNGEKHNNMGFRRSQDTERRKPSGTIRIFLLGGSAAYGLGGMYPGIQPDFAIIPNDQTIDAHLEKKLEEDFPGVEFEVINSAVTGYYTHHHLLNFITRLQHLEPDMILCLDGANDFNLGRRHVQYYGHAYRANYLRPVVAPSLESLLEVLIRWLGQYSLLVRKIGQRVLESQHYRNLDATTRHDFLRRGGVEARDDSSPFEEVYRRELASTEAFPAVYRQLLALCKLQNVHLVAIRQPLLLARDRATLTPVEQRFWDETMRLLLAGGGTEETRAEMVLSYEISDEILRELGHEGLQYVDLHTAVTGAKEQIFTDYCHISPEGGGVIAGILAREVSPAVREIMTRRRSPAP